MSLSPLHLYLSAGFTFPATPFSLSVSCFSSPFVILLHSPSAFFASSPLSLQPFLCSLCPLTFVSSLFSSVFSLHSLLTFFSPRSPSCSYAPLTPPRTSFPLTAFLYSSLYAFPFTFPLSFTFSFLFTILSFTLPFIFSPLFCLLLLPVLCPLFYYASLFSPLHSSPFTLPSLFSSSHSPSPTHTLHSLFCCLFALSVQLFSPHFSPPSLFLPLTLADSSSLQHPPTVLICRLLARCYDFISSHILECRDVSGFIVFSLILYVYCLQTFNASSVSLSFITYWKIRCKRE